MKYKIRDLRNDEDAKKDRDGEELAHRLCEFAVLFDAPRHKVGALINRLKDRFDFSTIKSEHTEKDRTVGK